MKYPFQKIALIFSLALVAVVSGCTTIPFPQGLSDLSIKGLVEDQRKNIQELVAFFENDQEVKNSKLVLYWRLSDGRWYAIRNATSTSLTSDLASEEKVFSEAFLQEGFSVSNPNFLEVAVAGEDDKYYGFEKNEVKCQVILSSDFNPTLICGKDNLENKENFIAFTSLFEEPGLMWTVDVSDGIIARGSASYGRGGYQWFSKKVSGKWEIILKTTEYPLCSFIVEYSIPKSVYSEGCMDGDGKIRP